MTPGELVLNRTIGGGVAIGWRWWGAQACSSLRGVQRRSNPSCLAVHGLPRGACHRARVRATRWLAMTPGELVLNRTIGGGVAIGW